MNALPLLKETYTAWSKNKSPRLAAALAYYTLFAMAPLLVILIQLGALLIGKGQAEGHHHEIQQLISGHLISTVGPAGAKAVNDMVQATVNHEDAGRFSSALGWIVLVVAAGGLFGSLQEALNTVWEVPEKEDQGWMHAVRERFLSFSMIAGVTFLLLVSLGINGAIESFSGWLAHFLPESIWIVKVINLVVAFGLITLLFAFIYKILPDVSIEWKDVFIGAVITALLFGVGQALLGLYIAKLGASSTYGAAGSLVVLLVWVNYSAQLLLFGAEFTHVYAKHFGSHQMQVPAAAGSS